MHARLQSVKRGRYESTTGRRFAESAVGRSEVGVKIFRGNHTLCSEGHVMHARLQSVKRGSCEKATGGMQNQCTMITTEETIVENNPVTLKDVVKETQPKDAAKKNPVELRDADEDKNKPVTLQDVVKDSKLKDAVEKKPVESPAIRCVGIEYAAGEARTVGDQALHTLRVGDKTDTMEIEGEHCLEAFVMNTASAHAFEEGYITAEKQGEVAENINGSGGGHASIQVFIVGCLSLLRGGDQNRTKSVESSTIKAVENDYTAENT